MTSLTTMTKSELIDRVHSLNAHIEELETERLEADDSTASTLDTIVGAMQIEGPVWDREERRMTTGNRVAFAQQFVVNGYLNSLYRARTFFVEKHDEAKRRLQAEIRADIGDEMSAQKIARALDFVELRQDEISAVSDLYETGVAQFEATYGEKFVPWTPRAGGPTQSDANRDELAKRLAAVGAKLDVPTQNTDGVDRGDEEVAA